MAGSSPRPAPNYDPFLPGQSHHSMVVECDVEDLGHMLRRADTISFGKFTIYCDEPAFIGGSGTAPAPPHYFAASILF